MAARPLVRFLAVIAFIPLLAVWADSGRKTDPPDYSQTALKTIRLPIGPGEGPIMAIAFSPDGRFIADAGDGIRLWRLPSGRRVSPPTDGRGAGFKFVAFSPDDRKVVTTHDNSYIGDSGRVIVRDKTDNRFQPVRILSAAGPLGPHGGIWPVAFSPDGKTMVAGELYHESLILWDTATGRQLLHFHGGVAAVFSSDGRTLISVSPFGRIHRWKAGTNQLLDSPDDEKALNEVIAVQWVAFSKDRRQVALGDGQAIWVKDCETGMIRCRLEASHELFPLAFSPDGRLLTAINGQGISFFDTGTGKEKGWVGGSGFGAFSPDGRLFAWSQKDAIAIEETGPLVAGGKQAPPPAATEPPGVPLQAELIARRKTYPLDLGGRSPEQFAQDASEREIDVPKLDLAVRLRNTGDRPLRLRSYGPAPGYVSASLAGPAAINYSVPRQTGIGFGDEDRKSMDVYLKPGDTISAPVQPLSGGSDAVFWAAPGEYRLRVSLLFDVSPAPAGAQANDDGFAWVRMCCPTLTLHVKPEKGLTSGRPEHPVTARKLGDLVPPPEDNATRVLRLRLQSYVNLDKGFDAGLTLKEVLDFIKDRYEVNWSLDEPAFQRLGKPNFAQEKTDGLLPIKGPPLEAILYLVLDPLGADFEVRQGELRIVPSQKPKDLSDRLAPSRRWFREKLQEPRTILGGIPADTPLPDALERLALDLDRPIVIDVPAFTRAGIKGIAKKPVQLAEQKDVPLRTALERLLQPIGATFHVRDRVIVVVPMKPLNSPKGEQGSP